MIAIRFLSREEWEPELRRFGCKPLAGKGLNTAELWQMPWQRYPFTVPIESDGRLLQFELDELILMIVECAPDGIDFPP